MDEDVDKRGKMTVADGPDSAAPRRVYNSDPILEAVCEVRFSVPTEGWAVLPGQLFERLRDRYPAEPTYETFPPLPVPAPPPGPSGAPGGLQVLLGPVGSGRVRLASSDGNSQLLVGPGVLGISVMKPYPGWPVFRANIEAALRAFAEVTNDQFSVQRIGLRYINRVETTLDGLNFFNVRPLSFGTMPLHNETLISRSELMFTDVADRLLVATFGLTSPLEHSEGSLVLDLDVIAQNLSEVDTTEAALALIQELRTLEREAFEATITEDARREIFGGYEELSDA